MRKVLATLALFLVVPSLPAADVAAPKTVYTAKEPKQSQVLIARQETGSTAYGTGSAIAYESGKTLILTNAHVARDNTAKYSIWFKGKQYDATYLGGQKVTLTQKFNPDGSVSYSIAFEDDIDLALLTVDVEVPTVPLAADNAKEGERIRQWGFSRFTDVKNEPGYKTGKVSDQCSAKNTTGTLPSDNGDSGSGLFNDANELVAVTAWGTTENEALRTIAMNNRTVRDFLRGKAGKLFPRLGARVAKVVEMPQ